ncbi:uroporphyrinogen decarboxylase family protein [Clostridium kluyveri]|uniref:Uroporphyrinogen decarboxylase n=1 Tax=Clostridium kluyveri TaxID=1534 RepID=A0A1L5F523_CLOKL|nr:uroporphyrinogen decarboxylase family protein [Clostridium kluyveri]APM38083.1 uroporphyrinogen decarboxylase [Clostridium kluyveri]
MNFDIDSICKGESIEQIPTAILDKTGIHFGDAHFKKDYMAVVSEKIKEVDKNCICYIPFSVTAEAEAFGAKVRLDEDSNGILIDGFKYAKIEELSDVHEFDTDKGRIKEILDCIEILSKRGNIVALNVEAPFTILTLLIDNLAIYRGLRRQGDIIYNALLTIQNSIRKYIIKALERGTRIISYADPSGDIDIIGPKIYKKFSGEISYSLIKSLEDYIDNSIIHLCARTSLPFEKSGFCESSPIEIKKDIKYGEAICSLLDEKDVKILGHKCMNCSNKMVEDSLVWKLELNNNYTFI